MKELQPFSLLIPAALFTLAATVAASQGHEALKPFLKEDSPVLVLEHVRIIDGTGAAPSEDQRIEIEGGKITRIESARLKTAYPLNAKVLDLTGKPSSRAW